MIGALPRCDFACRGCYLGDDANRTPAASLVQVLGQLETLREWLGEGGNLQMTDGEITLRDRDELVAIIQYARAIGLVPMLMTHGEGIRRDPTLLHHLVEEGGLREISIHIDTTQRGRRDPAYRYAKLESDLDPLRGEFADLIRRVRLETGCPLEAATTVTVTRENLPGVAGIVAFLARHADAFKMVSFQPVARVGRTEAELAATVDVDALWEQIELGLGSVRGGASRLSDHQGWLGHPDCSRFVQGLVRRDETGPLRFEPLFDPGDEDERKVVEQGLDLLGGLTFRLDEPRAAFLRALGVVLSQPRYVLTRLVPRVWRSLRRFAPRGRVRALLQLAAGRVHYDYFNVVSHHFMSAEEIATPRGQERLDLCAFKVPIDGELHSMCAVNSLGLREGVYSSLRKRAESFDGPAS